MSLSRASNFFRLPLPATSPVPLPFSGRYFYLIASTGPVEVKVDSQITGELKPGESFSTDSTFELLTFRSLTGAAQTIEFWAGFDRFESNRTNQIEAETEFLPFADSGGYAGGILAASGVLDLPGVSTLARIRRKAVQVSNLDASSNLHLCNSAGVVGVIVRPGETITQPVSGFLRILNPTAGAMQMVGSEIWWRA